MISIDHVTLLDAQGRARLEHVDLTVPASSVCAIVDRQAASDSDLVNLVMGFVAPTRGTVTVVGLEPSRNPERVRSRITHITGQAPLLPSLSVYRNLLLMLSLSGHPPASASTIVRALRDAEVPDRALRQQARRLPLFQRICVWLALARLRQSPVLVMESPTRDLSASEIRDLIRLIDECRRTGTSVLVTTEDGSFADAIGDAVAVLQQGRFDLRPGSRPQASVAAAGVVR